MSGAEEKELKPVLLRERDVWSADEKEREVLLTERDGDRDGDKSLPEPAPNPPVEPRPPPLVGADEPTPTADGGAASAAWPSAKAIPICSCVPSNHFSSVL